MSLRSSVALSRLDHVLCVRVSGEGAFGLIDRVFPRELFLRDGQLAQGLLLREDGTVFADCHLASDEDDFFLLVEGLSAPELTSHLRAHAPADEPVAIVDVSATHAILGIDGPYAWELIAMLVGQEAIGVPHLTFFRSGDVVLYRAGKTGEYGYGLIVPRHAVDSLWTEITTLGARLDAVEVGRDVLEACALENWYFDIRRDGLTGATPLELQLQWRVSRKKSFVGSEALAMRRARGITERLTCLVSEAPLEIGAEVRQDGGAVGRIVNAGFSPVRELHVAKALLATSWAYPGISGFDVDGRATARSVSPPIVNNRSLFVNPQVHSYATRFEDVFPGLAQP
jgi:glycine cleavage system aminomethyltransferase T